MNIVPKQGPFNEVDLILPCPLVLRYVVGKIVDPHELACGLEFPVLPFKLASRIQVHFQHFKATTCEC